MTSKGQLQGKLQPETMLMRQMMDQLDGPCRNVDSTDLVEVTPFSMDDIKPVVFTRIKEGNYY